ncbi:MAG: hypothetical protein ACI35R_16205 [Bacillus sp. (in: firmicutes)]
MIRVATPINIVAIGLFFVISQKTPFVWKDDTFEQNINEIRPLVFGGYAYPGDVAALFSAYGHCGFLDRRRARALQARGNSHRDVLESSYEEETLRHIALMEANAETVVIITDYNQNVIISSTKLDWEEQALISKKLGRVPRNGEK